MTRSRRSRRGAARPSRRGRRSPGWARSPTSRTARATRSACGRRPGRRSARPAYARRIVSVPFGPRAFRSSSVAVVLAAVALAACESNPTVPLPVASATTAGADVDVGGYALDYICEGTGSPTVLLDAGLGTAGDDEFGGFLSRVAKLGVRACTYDRAGLGASDARPQGDGLPTAVTEADELHALLESSDIETPLVYVPHSYAGLVARVFADRYPDDVAGFVFEDVSTAWRSICGRGGMAARGSTARRSTSTRPNARSSTRRRSAIRRRWWSRSRRTTRSGSRGGPG